MIRYHYGVNPDELEDDKYFKLWGELIYVLKIENKRMGLV